MGYSRGRGSRSQAISVDETRASSSRGRSLSQGAA